MPLTWTCTQLPVILSFYFLIYSRCYCIGSVAFRNLFEVLEEGGSNPTTDDERSTGAPKDKPPVDVNLPVEPSEPSLEKPTVGQRRQESAGDAGTTGLWLEGSAYPTVPRPVRGGAEGGSRGKLYDSAPHLPQKDAYVTVEGRSGGGNARVVRNYNQLKLV